MLLCDGCCIGRLRDDNGRILKQRETMVENLECGNGNIEPVLLMTNIMGLHDIPGTAARASTVSSSQTYSIDAWCQDEAADHRQAQ